MFALNCKGKIIDTKIPLVMGIINVTPDSFYQQNLPKGIDGILTLAEKMIADGADILDIGGQSTRPNSEKVLAEKELDRVIPIIEKISTHFPNTILSVDTYYSQVAIAAVQVGASIVNDISGGQLDNAMIPTVGKMNNVPYVCMHTKGTPQTMQTLANYDNIVEEITNYFVAKITECTVAGINDIIIDPGFGFAKNTNQNFELLKNLLKLTALKKTMLVGLSRKSMVYKTLGITAADALNGTTVLHTLALQNGANILRVHDVKEAREIVKLMDKIKYNDA